MREITFSRTFPAYHPKKGQYTSFVEKIWKALYDTPQFNELAPYQEIYNKNFGFDPRQFEPKLHTIRNGKKHKVGDFIKPMVWAGRPYNKTPEGLWKIQFAPPLEIVEVYDFEIKDKQIYVNGIEEGYELLHIIARNDGLSYSDLMEWFNGGKDFSGQVLCWGKVGY